MSPVKLILASASPRRRQLLTEMGLNFEVVPAEVTENEAHDADPRELVLHNAALKADSVAKRHADALVLGADTTAFIDQAVLIKPRDLAKPRSMLKKLSDAAHPVFQGMAALHGSG